MLCPDCGTDLEVEKELFGEDKFWSGHTCKGRYHKGTWCIYQTVFCQEGFCSDCYLTTGTGINYNGGKMILYKGKAKGMTNKELWLAWKFGRPIENLEAVDFSRN